MTNDSGRVREVVLERSGCQVHAWVQGPEAGPLVVLLHGAAMDHRMFTPQVPVLVAAGYRTMGIDLRGHGVSKPIGRTPLSITDLGDDVLALADAVGAEQFFVIGQSMGGYVAQDLVLRSPRRIIALAVIGTTCMTAPISWLEMLLLRSSPWWYRLWPWGNFRHLMAKSTAVTAEVRTYALEAINALDKQEFLVVWRAVTRAIQPRPGYRIEHPLLLVHGDQDRTGNIRRSMPAWADRDPRATFQVIPDAGHNANQDNSQQANRHLLEFLAQHGGGAQ